MKSSDKKRFAEFMYGLADNFRDQISEDGLRFRFAALQQYTIEQIEAAAMQIVRTRRFTKLPTIGDFVTAIEGDPGINLEDNAERQATIVLDAIPRIGSYGTPTFDDPITAEIVSRRFGWGHLCATVGNGNLTWFVKEFKDAYLSYARHPNQPLIEAAPQVIEIAVNIGNARPAPERPNVVQIRQRQQREFMLGRARP